MIEGESHPVSTAVDAYHFATKDGDQVVRRLERDSSQHRPLQVFRQTFDEVHALPARWQPRESDAMSVGLRPPLNRLRHEQFRKKRAE